MNQFFYPINSSTPLDLNNLPTVQYSLAGQYLRIELDNELFVFVKKNAYIRTKQGYDTVTSLRQGSYLEIGLPNLNEMVSTNSNRTQKVVNNVQRVMYIRVKDIIEVPPGFGVLPPVVQDPANGGYSPPANLYPELGPCACALFSSCAQKYFTPVFRTN